MTEQSATKPILKLFTLHYPGATWFKSFRAAYSLEAAVAAWGGRFVPREGGVCTSSTDPYELGTHGTLVFGPELFREMDSTDEALAGGLHGNVVYTEGGLGLLAWRGQTVELVVREHDLLLDEPSAQASQAA